MTLYEQNKGLIENLGYGQKPIIKKEFYNYINNLANAEYGMPVFAAIFMDLFQKKNRLPDYITFVGEAKKKVDSRCIRSNHSFRKATDYHIELAVEIRCHKIYPSLVSETLAVLFFLQEGYIENMQYGEKDDIHKKLDIIFTKDERKYGVHLFMSSRNASFYANKKEFRNKETCKDLTELYLIRTVPQTHNNSIFIFNEDDLRDIYENPNKHLWKQFLEHKTF